MADTEGYELPVTTASFAPEDFPFTVEAHNESTGELVWSADVIGVGALTVPALGEGIRMTIIDKNGDRAVIRSDGSFEDGEEFALFIGPPVDPGEYAPIRHALWVAWLKGLDQQGEPHPQVFADSSEHVCGGCGIRVALSPRQEAELTMYGGAGQDVRVACPLCASIQIDQADEVVNLAPAVAPPSAGRAFQPTYCCPLCGELSGLVIGLTQALCTNGKCLVMTFDPSLPDGGMRDPQVIDLDFPEQDAR